MAYHDELSAMNRLMEFTVLVEPRAIPAPSIPPVTVPPLCNFVAQLPKPAVPDLPVTAVLMEAQPFSGPIQLPSGSRALIAFALASPTEPSEEIAAMANETSAACGVQPKPSRRASRSSANSSRASRRKQR